MLHSSFSIYKYNAVLLQVTKFTRLKRQQCVKKSVEIKLGTVHWALCDAY